MEYGRIAKQSVSAIVRAVVALEAEGGDIFFGEPALNIADLFTTDTEGRGTINILDSSSLINNPRLYSAFMLYLLAELFETLPEVGDADKPRIVFFFDEAHLLFDNASDDLMEKIEQTIRLIRSKGVGVYFITQSPGDIPGAIASQLGNKIEHALRAYTPAERKALKAAAESFRENPDFNTEELLSTLGTGEAVVSMLDEKGVPEMAQHVFILPPESQMGMLSDEDRAGAVKSSNLYLKYNAPSDPDSAFEFLQRKRLEQTQRAALEKEQAQKEKQRLKEEVAAEKAAQKEAERSKKAIERGVKNVASTTAGTLGRQVGNILGGKLGGKFGKTLGGNLGASLGRNILGTLFRK